MRPVERIRRSEIEQRLASVAIERSVVARLALNAVTHMAGAALADPLRGSDRGVALSQVWAEHGQTGGAVVGGDMRVLAAQTGQAVAGRLSATSPIEIGRIERALDDFARALRTDATTPPHRNAAFLVEPMVRALAADGPQRAGAQGLGDDPVDRFVAIVDRVTAEVRGLSGPSPARPAG